MFDDIVILDDIKTLLDIDLQDTTKDNLLNIYIRKAVTTIKNYLNDDTITEEIIKATYIDAIDSLVVNAYVFKGKENVKTATLGVRTVIYSDNNAFVITDSIKNLLPNPRIKLF